jgi:hypothetical protein
MLLGDSRPSESSGKTMGEAKYWIEYPNRCLNEPDLVRKWEKFSTFLSSW